MTWKFDGRPQIKGGQLLYTMSSFVYYFKAIGEFRLELQSTNAQIASKLVILCPLWPQNLIDDLEKGHIFSTTSNCVLHFIAIYQFKIEYQSGNAKMGVKISDFFVPCDLEIWRMTLKYNRAPLLCSFKRYVSFHSLLWNLNEVTIRKHQIWVKIGDFFVPCDLEIWQMTLKNFYATSSSVHHS